MAVHYRTKGFVFKKENRSDADRIFTVFTYDFGRIEIFAKAIRKIASKLKGGIELFSLSHIEFIQGKNQKTLTDAVIIKKYKNIIEIPEKTEIAHKISATLDTFIKGQESDKKIWTFIIDFFQKLDGQQLSVNVQNLWYHYFIWNFVTACGYQPELMVCAGCANKLNPDSLYFSQKEGGIICNKCFALDVGARKIDSAIVKMLRLFLKNEWETVSKLKIESYSQSLLKEVSDDYYYYLMHSYFVRGNVEARKQIR